MEHNIIYCRDILLVNPYQSKKGQSNEVAYGHRLLTT